jgi:hypothetical protein
MLNIISAVLAGLVDLVQLGVLALLLGPDLNDIRRSGGDTDLLPFGIGTGACDGPLLVPGRIPAVWAGGVKVGITVTPDTHAHSYFPPSMASRSFTLPLERPPRPINSSISRTSLA